MRFSDVLVETICKQRLPYRVGEFLMMTELEVLGQPDVITVKVATSDSDIPPLIIYGGQTFESTAKMSIKVPVTWIDGKPKTRNPGFDNLDVIFIDEEMKIKDVQVGIITRRGKFILTAQVVYNGWVRGNEEMCFIPSRPEFAYPGMNYRETWKNMGEIVSAMGRMTTDIAKDLGVPLEEHEPAEWIPASIPEIKNWKRGTVAYFNGITGTGMIIGEDGAKVFVHFKNIITEKGVTGVLLPMTGVYYRPNVPAIDEKPCAISCKPA